MRPELSEAFLKFATAQLTAVRVRADREGVVEKSFVYKEFQGGRVISSIRFKNDYLAIFPSRNDTDFPKELGEAFVERLIDSGLFPKQNFSDASGKPIASPTREMLAPVVLSAARRLVLTVLEKHSLEASDEQILQEFSSTIAIWEEKIGSTKIAVPLLYFTSDIDEIDLGEGVKIRTVADDQKTKIWNSFHFIEDYIPDREFSDIKSFILTDRTSLRDEVIIKLVDSVVTALRLTKPGLTGTPGIFTASISPISEIRGGIFPRADLNTPANQSFVLSEDYFSLLKADIPIFEKTYRALQENGFAAYQHLHVPIGRFNKSYVREDDADKIIDLCIALESSLLYGVRDELSYRLALRASALLSPVRATEQSFKFLQVLYDVRSQIVHNGVRFQSESLTKLIKQKLDMRPAKFLGEVEAIARDIIQSLLKRFSSGETLEKVCNVLDATILHGIRAR